MSGLVLFVVAVVTVMLALAVHEGGHLLGAVASGSRPYLLVAGPFMVTWEEGKARIGWNTSLALAGGLASAIPPTGGTMLRSTALMIAGGPVTSLGVGILSIAGAIVTAEPLSEVLRLFGVVSGSLGLVTLLPVRTSGYASDGARILRFWRGGPQAARDAAVTAMVAATYAGVRPSDWETAWVEQATTLRDATPEEGTAQILAYWVALDRGEQGLAAQHLARGMALVDSLPASSRPSYFREAAFMAATAEGDPERAAAFLAKRTGDLIPDPACLLRCEAAIRLARGERAQALAKVEQGLALLAGKRLNGGELMEESLLLQVRAAAQTAAPPE